MENISQELKDIYLNDMLPLTEEIAYKQLILYFPGLDLTITNDRLVSESMELTESLCESDNLSFGECQACKFSIIVADVEEDLKGQKVVVTQIINEEHEFRLGEFIVESSKREDDQRFKKIIAYDQIKDTDIDVADWFNNLNFDNLTLVQFRTSLLSYLGIEEDTSILPLPNDNMKVDKTIEPSQIRARDILICIEEINGCFGHINRQGKFSHIVLPELYGDYPQLDYPMNDYPEEENNEIVYSAGIIDVKFEDFICKGIDKLQIRQEENDIGCIVGTGTNAYIIEGNFLVYGKSHEELTTIANNIIPHIFDREYRPYKAQSIGIPFINIGDVLKFDTKETVRGYVFSRTLKGIQFLKDEFEARGSEEQEQNFGANKEIIQLKGKATKIEKTVEGVRVEVSDLDTRLSSEIEVLAGEIVLKVDNNGKLGYVALSADPEDGMTFVKIAADSIELEGLVTVNGNFKVLEDGKIEAVNGKFSGYINSSEYIGGLIRSENYRSGISGMAIDLYNSTIDMINLYIDPTGRIRSTNGEFITNGVNGSVTIKDGKITLKNAMMQSTAEIDGADMWIDYIIIRETANFMGSANFQLNSEPTLSIGGVSHRFITTANVGNYIPTGYVTSAQLLDAMNTFNTDIRNWVTANFESK